MHEIRFTDDRTDFILFICRDSIYGKTRTNHVWYIIYVQIYFFVQEGLAHACTAKSEYNLYMSIIF